ncbi:unnamed protein product [Ilex paraguariensis]|uniref:Late embryogenesis abundant protein LEA-2 subgroup domain-containing protein n=1 Tax=Ilex paraguariensis TaxID=185542 RepID=A0ABC8U9Y6_9AQUA
MKGHMTTGDQESAAALRRKRNLKCLALIVAGVILQAAVILVFVLTIMRIRNPKVRFSTVTVQNLRVNSSSSPSFSMKLNAQFTVKNTNFGHFKFQSSTATILYEGKPVGEAVIDKARARARSTKKLNITVGVNSEKETRNSQLSSDIKSGKITLTSQATLKGKVHLFKVIRKKKSAQMNCTMDVNTKTHAVENLHCK